MTLPLRLVGIPRSLYELIVPIIILTVYYAHPSVYLIPIVGLCVLHIPFALIQWGFFDISEIVIYDDGVTICYGATRRIYRLRKEEILSIYSVRNRMEVLRAVIVHLDTAGKNTKKRSLRIKRRFFSAHELEQLYTALRSLKP